VSYLQHKPSLKDNMCYLLFIPPLISFRKITHVIANKNKQRKKGKTMTDYVEVKALRYSLRLNECFSSLYHDYPTIMTKWANKETQNKVLKKFAENYEVKLSDLKKEAKKVIRLKQIFLAEKITGKEIS